MKLRAVGSIQTTAVARMGATAVPMEYSEVYQALQTGAVDGAILDMVSAANTHVWETGIRTAIDNKQEFHQYIPNMNMDTWRSLTQSSQLLLMQSWHDVIRMNRDMASEWDRVAKASLESNGVQVFIPPDAAIVRIRAGLMAEQGAMVKSMGLDPALVALIGNTLASVYSCTGDWSPDVVPPPPLQ